MNEVIIGSEVFSVNSGVKFLVTGRSRYALNSPVSMIEYTNLEPTHDTAAGQKWVLDEITFLKRFTYDQLTDA